MTATGSQERHLKVIVFSDVVDSSAQIFADELIAIQRIKEDLAMIREALQRHGGSLVKSLGDGIMATFDSPTQALEFVQDVVILITRRGRQSLQHRFGLHTGEIYVNGDDIIGQGVHLASRLQTTAPANGVAFVQSTFDLIDPRFQRLAALVGPVQLKGMPGPITCYSIESKELLGNQRGKAQAEVDLEALLADTPYRLERHLGSSPQTRTFLVREGSRNRRAVLKLIPCDATNLDALQVEAACLDRLRHPRVPRFVDGFEHRGSFLFLQEYIAGASLQGSLDFLRRKQRLAELLRQVLEVLQGIHAAGIVHGDLHPANLVAGENGGALFVVDFGLLKAQTSGEPAGGEHLAGRPFFSSPERARFGSLTAAGDLYSLGVLALSLYTGQAPDELYDQAQGRWLLEDLDPEVIGWLAPLLEESPARRVKSAGDALQMLDRPQPPAPGERPSGTGPLPRPLPPLPKVSGPIRRAILHRRLAATYGPVVELLLQSSPTSLPADEVEGLRQRLVGAGLSLGDVDRALLEAMEGPATPAAADPVAPGPDPGALPIQGQPTGKGNHAEAWKAGLLGMLRLKIGPIADTLCTEDLYGALADDPPAAGRMLLQTGVPSDVVDELVTLSQRTRPAAGTVPVRSAAAPASPTPAPPPAAEPEAMPDARLREVVQGVIGPIGSTLLDSVAHLPADQRIDSLISALEGYGVETATLNELRRRVTEGSRS